MSDARDVTKRQTKSIATVLVADDDLHLRKTARIILETNGYQVVEAEDGEAALRAIEEVVPDAALVDLVMPLMDGQEVLRKARNNWGLAPPIIIMTGYASVDTVVDLMREGASDCLAKPFQEDDLLGKIERALGLESFDDADEESERPVKLSRREIDVLLLLREGLTNKQIADRMLLGLRTIDEYVRRLCEKLEVSNRTGAVAWSYRYPMLELKDPRQPS